MRRERKRAAVLLLVLAMLLLAGCEGWLGPSIEGEWQAFGDYLVDFGGSVGGIGDLAALVDSGEYRFEYTMTDPYPDGPSVASWQEGSLSPADPGEGDTFTMTISAASSDDYSPPPGESFDGTVVFLDRDVLVLDIDVGDGAPIMTWSFRRQ